MNKYIKLLIESYFESYKILNLHEIPILNNIFHNINETHISEIPEAKFTKSTEDTIKYVIDNSILDINHIEDNYYHNALSIAISIITYWNITELTDIEYNNIITLFKNCGYYLVYTRLLSHDNITYKVMYFEPYNLENSLIKYPEYVL